MKNSFRDTISFPQSNPCAHSSIGYWSIDDVSLPTFNYTGKIPYQVTASDGVKITHPEDPWFLIGNYAITSFVHTSGAYDLYTLVDGKVYNSIQNEHKTTAEWPFDQSFHLKLNLAIGGAWGGQQSIDDSIFPQQMVVDYIRVYQLK